MGILRRSMMIAAAIGAAGAIAAGGTVPALAETTSGVRYLQVQSTGVAGPSGTQCTAVVLSAAVSTGNPAYVSAMVTNTLTNACTGWLQNSVDGGDWTDVSPRQSVPGGQGLNHPAWYKTANYYAGPGTSIRACLQYGSGTARCSNPVSLAQSTATPASDATPVYYAQKQLTVGVSGGSGQGNRDGPSVSLQSGSARHGCARRGGWCLRDADPSPGVTLPHRVTGERWMLRH